jgi:methionyl-tRNA synthetase
MKKKFYITTAIDYVNASPHLGHALEKIQADVIARYFRSLRREVLFLTGTDENSLKNVRAAESEGISTQELVDRNAKRFYQLKEALNLSFDDFIRTTESRHIKGAQKLWLACKKDIYKKNLSGIVLRGVRRVLQRRRIGKWTLS